MCIQIQYSVDRKIASKEPEKILEICDGLCISRKQTDLQTVPGRCYVAS